MANVAVDICNLALVRIGHRQVISSLTDQSVPSQLCNIIYGTALDMVLADFPWPFAIKYVALALLTSTRPGWGLVYAAPSDMIRAREIFSGARPGGPISAPSPIVDPTLSMYDTLPAASIAKKVPFAVALSDDGASRVILTDQPSAQLAYVARVTNVVAFPPLFVQCLVWKVAEELSLGLSVKRDIYELCKKSYQEMIARAGAQAFNEESEDRQPESEFINARG